MSRVKLGGNKSLTEAPGEGVRKGVYSLQPGLTPKTSEVPFYEGGDEELCRLFVQLPSNRDFKKFQSMVRSLYGVEAAKLTKELVGGRGYVDFLVTSISRSHQEKAQIVPVLSDKAVVYAFGQNPVQLQVRGVLLNTEQDDNSTAFDILYQSVLRATRLADIQAKCYFFTPDRYYVGCFINYSPSQNSEMQSADQFSFQFLVSKMYVYHRPDHYPTKIGADDLTAHKPTKYALLSEDAFGGAGAEASEVLLGDPSGEIV